MPLSSVDGARMRNILAVALMLAIGSLFSLTIQLLSVEDKVETLKSTINESASSQKILINKITELDSRLYSMEATMIDFCTGKVQKSK